MNRSIAKRSEQMPDERETPVKDFLPESIKIPCLGASLMSAVYVALFQSGAMSFISTHVPSAAGVLTPLFYFIYGSGGVIMLWALLRNPPQRRLFFRICAVCVLALLPLLLANGGVGGVTKSYIVALGSLLLFTTIASVSDLRRLGQFAASVTCLVSLFCLVDACFLDGFTNTNGRAASLLVNPNVAAISLLLGASGSIWALVPRWRPAFIVLVGGGVFATLSRSSMLLGAMTLLACIPLLISDWRHELDHLRAAVKPTLVVLVMVMLLLGGAVINNKAFGVAAGEAFQGLRTAVAAWQNIQSRILAQGSQEFGEAYDKVRIPAEMVAEAERENSVSARALLFQRSLVEYLDGPALGHGLERAFALSPHNSYLLFAVAFGHMGWLIVPLLVGLIFLLTDWRRGFPSAVLVAATGIFSHDLFLALPLVAGMTVVFTGLIASAMPQQEEQVGGLVPFALVALVLAAASLFGLLTQASRLPSYELEIPTNAVTPILDGVYYVAVPPATPKGLVRLDDRPASDAGERGLIFTESGRKLRASDSLLEGTPLGGGGSYIYENMGLIFSAIDNSNPLTNGKRYRFSAPVVIHPLFFFMVFVLFAWSAAWLFAAIFRKAHRGNRACADL